MVEINDGNFEAKCRGEYDGYSYNKPYDEIAADDQRYFEKYGRNHDAAADIRKFEQQA